VIHKFLDVLSWRNFSVFLRISTNFGHAFADGGTVIISEYRQSIVGAVSITLGGVWPSVSIASAPALSILLVTLTLAAMETDFLRVLLAVVFCGASIPGVVELEEDELEEDESVELLCCEDSLSESRPCMLTGSLGFRDAGAVFSSGVAAVMIVCGVISVIFPVVSGTCS
jgi:hypothetical protein